MSYETILTETRPGAALAIGLITLNRPKQLNALNDALMDELGAALLAYDADDSIGCIVLTGSEKAFAAGEETLRPTFHGSVARTGEGIDVPCLEGVGGRGSRLQRAGVEV